MSLDIRVFHQSIPLAKLFRISRGAKSTAEIIVVVLSDGEHFGWGEAVPYARYQESIDSVGQQLWQLQNKYSGANIAPEELVNQLKPGSAKNALDCAIWDLRSKQQRKSIDELIQMPSPKSCITAQTLSVDSASEMQREAKMLGNAPLVKIKLDAESIIPKMQAIYAVCPDSQFIIDANEGWTLDVLSRVVEPLKEMNVVLIEQPLPSGDDELLEDFASPIPLCADESCHTSGNLDQLQACFQHINIKLDKTGGLTEALTLLKEAQMRKMGIMVGCMVGTSLAMAPAFALCNHADYVDLDGPLLVANDRSNGFLFDKGKMCGHDQLLWGTPHQSNSLPQIQSLMKKTDA